MQLSLEGGSGGSGSASIPGKTVPTQIAENWGKSLSFLFLTCLVFPARISIFWLTFLVKSKERKDRDQLQIGHKSVKTSLCPRNCPELHGDAQFAQNRSRIANSWFSAIETSFRIQVLDVPQ